MQKQEFEERIERTVTDEQYKVIEEVYMWHPSIRNTSGKGGCEIAGGEKLGIQEANIPGVPGDSRRL